MRTAFPGPMRWSVSASTGTSCRVRRTRANVGNAPCRRPTWPWATPSDELFVERYFPAGEKARAEQMVRNLIAAFDRRIDNLAWMAPADQAPWPKPSWPRSRSGSATPSRWRDYSALEVVRGDALGNLTRAELFELRRNLAKLGQPIDREEWVHESAARQRGQPARHERHRITRSDPAAAAVRSAQHTAAMDYGATGATIGHEISHSFDDQGALFDAGGRLRQLVDAGGL